MRHLLILISFLLLLSSPLFGEDKPCYVSVTSSEDFNQTLLSNISISVISQYLKNVKPFPPSGLSGNDNCIYEVTATKDKEKTFVTLQGNNLNSFGDASSFGTDGFKESILRSLYRSQRDKRGLICSDYPKILEECGGVVRKSANLLMKVFHDSKEIIKEKFTSTDRSEIPAKKEGKPRESKTKEKVVVSKQQKSTKKKYKNEKGVWMCWFPKLNDYRDCNWRDRGRRTAEAVKRGTKECGGFMNWVWTDEHHSKYRCKGNSFEETKPKRDCSQKWECIVPPCDFIGEDGCLIED